MTIPIEITPKNLQDIHSYGETSLSEAIARGFNGELTECLAANTTQAHFDTSDVIDNLHKTTEESTEKVFESRYRFECEYSYDGKPVHLLLGELALGEDSVAELVPSAAFMDDLHEQIESHSDGVDALKYLHDLWPPKTFEYLSNLDNVSRTDDSDTGNKMFEIVQNMSEDAENLTLDVNSSEGLLLLVHLPWQVRQLTRRLLVGNHFIARLDSALGDSKTAEEDELLKALHRYYILDNMHGQHWEMKNSALSEGNQVEVARYSAEQLKTLAYLQQKADKESGLRFKEMWYDMAEELSGYIEDVAHSSRISQWQDVDIGHAFEGFVDGDLYKAFRFGTHSKDGLLPVDMLPQKSGLKAVILEDDDSQRSLWLETIQRSTSFTADEALAFNSPSEVDSVIDDPTIGFFLLDIQNGGDLTAGIRVGEEVIRRRLAMGEAGGEAPPTKVIIWSASSAAVDQASHYFDGLVRTQGLDVDYRLLGHGGISSSRPVCIDVRPKTWHSYGDIE